MEKPWDENVVQLTECYSEKYPTGKRNYEMVEFGPVYESRFLYIPADTNDVDQYILAARCKMHDRLVASVKDMVNKAVSEKRIIGMELR